MGEKGQNPVEFSVIIALVGLFSLLVWTMLGDTVTQLFRNSSIQIAGYKPFGGTASVGFGNNITGGSLGGTPKSPVQVCDNGSCTIDFGSYILQGVPENLQDYAFSNGASGGMDKMVNLMMQIADQLEKKGDLTGSQDYRDMANLCHLWSTASKTLEDNAKSTTSRSDLYTSIAKQNMIVPNELSHLLSSVPSTMDSLLMSGNTLGFAKQTKNNYPSYFSSVKSSKASYNIVDLYDKIQNESKYPQELKNITTELYLQTNAFIQTQNLNFVTLVQPSTNFYTYIADPLTGNEKGLLVPTNTSTMLQDITHTKISTGSHFNSELICAAGNNVDVKNTCYK